MTKFAAILLLTVHLCSIGCYTFVFNYFIQATDGQMDKKSGNTSYDERSLVEISVPLNMPYMVNQTDYECINGNIEFNGMQYNYVKRKITNDTLYILCLPNLQKTQLYNAKTDYAKQMSDVPFNKKNNEQALKKAGVLSEYNFHTTQYDLTLTCTFHKNNIATINTFIVDCFIETPGKPPQSIA